jgi:hypothetical protein
MTDLFDIRVWLYPGANSQADPAIWEPFYVDISSSVRHPGDDGGQAITYTGGAQDEAKDVDAGQMQLSLDNRDGKFSTDNLAGPYSTLLDLNTPIRVAVRSWVDNFTRSVVNGWGSVDTTQLFAWNVATPTNFQVDGAKGTVLLAAANTATSALASRATAKDVDVVSTITPVATATGASYGLGTQLRLTDNSNNVYSTLEFDTAGTCTIKIRQVVAGVNTQLAAQNPIPASTYTAGVAWKLRTQADGGQMRVKAWPAAGTEPTSWMITAAIPGALTGSSVGIYAVRFVGNTNSGVVPFISLDDFTVTAFEFTGAVVSWPLDWDVTGNNSWAAITAAGILRQLRQGTNPVQSPLRRQLAGTADKRGYWPLEDGLTAKAFSSEMAINTPATFVGMTPAQEDTLAGGGPAPTATDAAGGSITATVHAVAGVSTGVAVMFLARLSSVPATKTRIARFRTSRGPVPIWDLSLDTSNIYTEGIGSDGSVVTSATNLLAPLDPTKWFAWQLETDNSTTPGNTDWASITHTVGEITYYAQSGTVAGATVTDVSWIQLSGPQGTSFAHLWSGRNTLPFVTNSFSLVSAGYAGELAADRFARVCTEAGIPYIVQAGTSEKMGPQPRGGTLAILNACAKADYAVMAERGSGLEFIPRSARWNLAVRMALSKASGEIDKVPKPVRDDQKLVNKFTMTRTDGGSATYQDAVSSAKVGTWEDSDTVNVFDESVLLNQAAWRVNVGTVKKMRWPSIAVNYARNRLLIPFWRARSYGFRLTATTGLGQLTGNEPDMVVQGFSATLWPNGWTVDMNATDSRVWRSAVTDDTGILGRVDSDACTTTALISATALSIPITTTVGQLKWDNTAGLWSGGVDFNVGGERITVTSITNGAGQAQTLNATVRGVAGYSASHASGSAVSLWDPAVVGF